MSDQINSVLMQAVNAAITEKSCAVATSTYSGQLSKCPTLKKGVNNKSCVETLQKALHTHGEYVTSKIDGVFDSKTYDAVCKFQKKNKLTVNRVVVDKTKAKL